MKMFAKWLAVTAVVTGGMSALPAAAQLQFGRMDTGLYLGGSVGGSKYRNACEGTPAGVSCDDKDIAWRAFAGWQFNRWLGVEVGYASLGKAQANLPAMPAIGFPGAVGPVRARGVDVVGVVTYPINNLFGVYGKLGVAHMRTKADLAGVGSITDNNTDLTYGLGVRVNFVRNISARAEWQRYQGVGDNVTGGTGTGTGLGKVDTFNLGLLYSFY